MPLRLKKRAVFGDRTFARGTPVFLFPRGGEEETEFFSSSPVGHLYRELVSVDPRWRFGTIGEDRTPRLLSPEEDCYEEPPPDPKRRR